MPTYAWLRRYRQQGLVGLVKSGFGAPPDSSEAPVSRASIEDATSAERAHLPPAADPLIGARGPLLSFSQVAFRNFDQPHEGIIIQDVISPAATSGSRRPLLMVEYTGS